MRIFVNYKSALHIVRTGDKFVNK